MAFSAYISLRPKGDVDSRLFYVLRPPAMSAEQSGALRRRELEVVQALVAQCMSSHDMKYVPYLEARNEPPDAELSPLEWAKVWGFGISTAAQLSAQESQPDPNMTYLASLPGPQGQAYRLALFGTATGVTPGCMAEANSAVYRRRERALGDLYPQLAHLAELAARDPRVISAGEEWLACVSGRVDLRAASAAAMLEYLRLSITAELERIGPVTKPISEADASALRELQEKERKVAIAVAECDVPRVATADLVLAEYQSAFIREHEAEMDLAADKLAAFEDSVGLAPRPSSS